MLRSAIFASTSARADTFRGLVVLGDSLSDSGNAGRFTNGPVWVEGLAKHLGLALRPSRAGGTNYAVGGARAAGGPNELRAQVRAYLAERRGMADPGVLHVVWAGGNDLLAAGLAANPDAAGPGAAAAVGEAVAALAQAGARTLLVPNLPDVGMTPALQTFGPAEAAAARRRTYAYDDALARALDRVEARQPVAILRLDVRALAERVLADPGAAGFRNLTKPCQGRPTCEGALFWDLVHPTAQAHARLAAAALDVLELAASR